LPTAAVVVGGTVVAGGGFVGVGMTEVSGGGVMVAGAAGVRPGLIGLTQADKTRERANNMTRNLLIG
jgi:hypothetical protein